MIKSIRLTDAEKDNIKELVTADIQINETLALEMNAVNNETVNVLKQSSNDCMETLSTDLNATN